MLASPSVGADSSISTAAAHVDTPDLVIAGHYPCDAVPGTSISRQAHLEREYIDHPDQLILYDPAPEGLLSAVFDT